MRIKRRSVPVVSDLGVEPLVINIDNATSDNQYFRSTLWTGNHLQVTLMSIDVGDEIGAEVHGDTDQFIRIEGGRAKVLIGNSAEEFYYQRIIDENYAVIIPAGTWHNIVNIGTSPLKLYSIYSPPHHPAGTVHISKEDAR